MMFVWPEGGEPMLVNNLVRMSQGAMMGVKFNKNKTWVGASIAPASGAAGNRSPPARAYFLISPQVHIS